MVQSSLIQMKYFLTPFVFLVTLIPSQAQQQELTQELQYWSNGQKKVEGAYKGTDAMGKWTWWYANGNKEMEGTFEHGVGQGTWTWFHMNGNKMQQGKYKVGIKEGEWLAWYPTGDLLVVGHLKDGRYQGKFTFYYDWGELKRVEIYDKGKLTSTEYRHPKLAGSDSRDPIPF